MRLRRAWLLRALLLGAGALLVALLASAKQPAASAAMVAPEAVGASTPICGAQTTQTWTALGSPYVICASGATVTANSTVTVDGSLGPVQIVATGGGSGLTVAYGGQLLTANTSSTNDAVYTVSGGSPGIAGGLQNNGTTQLAYVEFDYADVDNSSALTLDHSSLRHMGCVAVLSRGGEATIRTSSITTDATSCPPSSIPPGAIAVASSALDLEGDTITNDPAPAVAVRDDWGLLPTTIHGLTIDGVGGSGTPAIDIVGNITASWDGDAPAIVTGNTITNSAADGEPAIRLANVNTAPDTDLSGNVGSNDGVAGVSLAGVTFDGDSTWQGLQPEGAGALTPLGWYLDGTVMSTPGATITVPTNAVVKAAADGALLLRRGSLVAESGSVLTSMRDNAVGPAVCPSADAGSDCTPRPGDWAGVGYTDGYPGSVEGTLSVSGASLSYACTALSAGYNAVAGNAAPPTVAVDGTTFSNDGAGVSGQAGAVTVTDSVFAHLGAPPAGTPPLTGCSGTGVGIRSSGPVTVHASAFSDLGGEGVLTTDRQPVDITDSSFVRVGTAGTSAIQVMPTTLALTGNSVTDSGTGPPLAPAISIIGFTGSPPPVTGNVGSGNAEDAIAWLGPRFTGDVTWVGATNSATAHPLGWVAIQLVATGPGTLTVPAGAALATYLPTDLYGENLDATAGDAAFLPDASLPAGCPEEVGGGSPYYGVPVVIDAGCASLAGELLRMEAPTSGGSAGWLAIKNAASTIGPISSTATLPDSPPYPGSGFTIDGAPSVAGVTVTGGSVLLNALHVAGDVTTTGAATRLTGVTGARNTQFSISPTADEPVLVSSSTARTIAVSGAGAPTVTQNHADWISVGTSTQPVVTDNDVRQITLAQDSVNLDRDVYGNTGPYQSPATGVYAPPHVAVVAVTGVVLSGVTLTADATWVNPSGGAPGATVPLGYYLDGLTVPAPWTLTFPAGSVVESVGGGVAAVGGAMAVGTGSLFTSLADPAAPYSSCATTCSYYPGTDGTYWLGIFATHDPAGTKPSINVDGSEVRFAEDGLHQVDGSTTIRCSTIDRSTSYDLTVDGGSVSAEQSNIVDNVSTAPAIDLTQDWWGQAGGPRSGQVTNRPGQADTSSPLSAPASCAPPPPGASPPSPPPADATAPSVTLTGPARPFQLSPLITVAYGATDPDSAVASYDVRMRQAAWNGGFGAYLSYTSWQHTTQRSETVRGAPGREYCFGVRARDAAGNVSGWSPDRCTALPLDDRSLTAGTGGWTRGTNARYYAGTYTTTSSAHAVLQLRGAQLDRLALVVTRCSTCGALTVYLNGVAFETINTQAAKPAYQTLVLPPAFSLRTATVTLRTTGTRPVLIDGIGISRN